MSVNAGLTANRAADAGPLCTSCGAASDGLSAVSKCMRCEAAAVRHQVAADELRTWKRYSPGSFR